MASGRSSSSYRPFKQAGPPRVEQNANSIMSSQTQRLRPSRKHSSTVGTPGSLRLPGLPRFHPANFPSAHSSMQNTPTSGINSPQPPMSPRSQQRQYNDAQRALMSYQREFYNQQVAVNGHKRQSSSNKDPISPRLLPAAGSPGPMTPLELEAESYLTARSGATNQAERAEYVERVIREQVEGMRSGNVSPGHAMSSTPVTPPVSSY